MGHGPLPPALERVIKNLSFLPGIGEKTATRLALFILRMPRPKAEELGRSILELQDKIRLCSRCFTFSEEDPCSICTDPKRDQSVICVVEDPGDIVAVEAAHAFRGVYHVLHGALNPMDGIGPEELKIKELLARLDEMGNQGTPVTEVILATSSTSQGEATSTYLLDLLAKRGVRVTRIACGIPMGMDLKYADPLTLRHALKSRQSL